MALVYTKEWRRIRKALKDASGAHVKVGVLSAKGGTEAVEGGDIDIITLAAIHEYGAPKAGIPERSYIRRTLGDTSRVELAAFIARIARAVMAGKMTAERALDMLGAWAVNRIKRAITSGEGIPPPLQAATIAAKGSSRPLVDTGRLLGAITWLVFRESGEAAEGLRGGTSGEIGESSGEGDSMAGEVGQSAGEFSAKGTIG